MIRRLLLLYLYGLHGVGDQVHKHARKLRLRPHHRSAFHTDIGEFDVVLVVEHRYLLLQKGVQVYARRLLSVELGEGRELVGGVGKDVDVVEHDLRHLVELVLPSFRSALLQADETL